MYIRHNEVMNKRLKLLIITGIVIAVSFGIYESAIFAPTITQGESSRLLGSFESDVAMYDIAVLATIESVKTKLVDESKTSQAGTYDEELKKFVPYGEPMFEEQHVPYQFITLRIDEYIKDSTGNFAETLTVRDKANAVGTWKNMKVKYESEEVVDYTVGEQSVYIIGKSVDGTYLFTPGFVGKYNILDDGTIQTKDMADVFESQNIAKGTIRQPISSFAEFETSPVFTNNNAEDYRKVYGIPIPLNDAIIAGKHIAQEQQAKLSQQ